MIIKTLVERPTAFTVTPAAFLQFAALLHGMIELFFVCVNLSFFLFFVIGLVKLLDM